MLMTWNDFRNEVLKTHKKGTTFKVRGSQGNRAAYRYIHTHFFPIKDEMTEEQFGHIISVIHKYIIEITLKGLCFSLPYKLGQLRIGRIKRNVTFDENGKVRTNLLVNWRNTLQLWHDDPEAYKERILVRNESDHTYKIMFSKKHFVSKNKGYYDFIPSRTYKSILKEHIRNNDINVFDL